MADTWGARVRRSIDAVFTISIELLGLLTQLLLVVLGLMYLFIDDTDELENDRLLIWAVVASCYIVGTIFWLNLDLRLHDDDHMAVRRLSAFAPFRWFSSFATFCTSFVGLTAAATLILMRGSPDHLVIYEVIAVWAMLASWAMFQWGYARIYYAKYHHREFEKPLRFPDTPQPRMVDFVFFAFTTATSLGPTNVTITTSRMRWTVVWHSTLSFFFNGVIVVLSINTITGGFQGS